MLESYQFYNTVRVRYSEIDGQKIVFNAHYLTYIDVTIIEYVREVIGENWMELAEKHIFDIALVNINIDFKAPARLDDELKIYCRINKLGNSSYNVSFAISRFDEEIVLTAEAVYVNYNPSLGKAQPIPPDIREKIEQFEKLKY